MVDRRDSARNRTRSRSPLPTTARRILRVAAHSLNPFLEGFGGNLTESSSAPLLHARLERWLALDIIEELVEGCLERFDEGFSLDANPLRSRIDGVGRTLQVDRATITPRIAQ